jgi:hypothetical protein
MNRLPCLLALALLTSCATGVPPPKAQPPPAEGPVVTVDQLLVATVSQVEQMCVSRRGTKEREFRSQGNLSKAHFARLADVMLCECGPSRLKALRASLSREALAQEMTESEFIRQHMQGVTDTCAGQQVRNGYGAGCTEAFAAKRDNSARYCGCMRKALADIPDVELARTAYETSDHGSRAAAAERRGERPPEMPAKMKHLIRLDTVCSVE